MPKINPEIESFARIKVVGIGGAGTNSVNHMINSKVQGVEFICVNTDTQHLHHSKAKKKIHIGKNITKGLGAGMDPELGKRAAEETKTELQDVLRGADMVFLSCGLGGGTGTGGSSVIARLAKEQGILTIGVVTQPFFFEGSERIKIARRGLQELEKEVDALIVIPNDRLLSSSDPEMSFKAAFDVCDDVLRQAVQGISDLITTPGIINIDFADINTIMRGAGTTLMGIGSASGADRAEKAALQAINSPLMDLSINGARRVLFSISGGDDLKISEVEHAAKLITESIDREAKVIFGTIRDNSLKKKMRITVIATNFPPETPDQTLFQVKEEQINESVFPLITKSKEEKIKAEKKKEEKSEAEMETEEMDDWNAIPAFLRRSKK